MTEAKQCSKHLRISLEGLLGEGRFDTVGNNSLRCQQVGQKPQSEPLGDYSLKWPALAFVKTPGEGPPALKPDPQGQLDRKSTRLNSSHSGQSRMPSSA